MGDLFRRYSTISSFFFHILPMQHLRCYWACQSFADTLAPAPLHLALARGAPASSSLSPAPPPPLLALSCSLHGSSGHRSSSSSSSESFSSSSCDSSSSSASSSAGTSDGSFSFSSSGSSSCAFSLSPSSSLSSDAQLISSSGRAGSGLRRHSAASGPLLRARVEALALALLSIAATLAFWRIAAVAAAAVAEPATASPATKAAAADPAANCCFYCWCCSCRGLLLLPRAATSADGCFSCRRLLLLLTAAAPMVATPAGNCCSCMAGGSRCCVGCWCSFHCWPFPSFHTGLSSPPCPFPPPLVSWASLLLWGSFGCCWCSCSSYSA